MIRRMDWESCRTLMVMCIMANGLTIGGKGMGLYVRSRDTNMKAIGTMIECKAKEYRYGEMELCTTVNL